MEYKILEANGVENENVDGAAFNNFTAGGRNGIIKGILNECFVSIDSGKTIRVDTGEIIIQGFRVKITSAYSNTFTSFPAISIPYQLVARITLLADRTVSFTLDCRETKNLTQDNLYSVEEGTYEVEIARFTLTPEDAKDLIRTIDIISAGTGQSGGGNTGPVIKKEIMTGGNLCRKIFKGDITPLSIITADWIPELAKYNGVYTENTDYAVKRLQWSCSLLRRMTSSSGGNTRGVIYTRAPLIGVNAGGTTDINIYFEVSSGDYYRLPKTYYYTRNMSDNTETTFTGSDYPNSFIVTYIENEV